MNCTPMPRAGYHHDFVDGYKPTFWTHCWGKDADCSHGQKVILCVEDGKPYIWNADSGFAAWRFSESEYIGPFETLDAAFVALELLGE